MRKTGRSPIPARRSRASRESWTRQGDSPRSGSPGSRYLQADFDNYRKSLEREREQVIQLAGESLVRDLLPVLDDLDRALPSLSQEKNREGFELLSRKLHKILEKHGLKSIESHGKRFDPNFHEAIAKEESDEDEGTILEEYQKGYLLRIQGY